MGNCYLGDFVPGAQTVPKTGRYEAMCYCHFGRLSIACD
jgi:hypothetical protein